MQLKIVDNEESGLSEEGLISVLMGNEFTPKQKPTPDMVLVQQATDFWVEQWRLQGVEILSAELETEFDPEDDIWYFVIQLTCDINLGVVEFVERELEIFDILVRDDSTSVWSLKYDVLTRNIHES